MPTTARKTHYADSASFRSIILLSAWGFVLVVVSFLFLWIGCLLDGLLGTAPIFMLCFLFLSIIGCFIELCQEALKMRKDARK